MKKLQLGRDALVLSILSLITVLTWIGFDVYRALTKTEIPQILQRQLTPLDPKIPAVTFQNLEQRVSFTQEELSQITVPTAEEELVEEELIEETEEVATESGTVATESGILE